MDWTQSAYLTWKKAAPPEVQRMIEALGRYLIAAVKMNQGADSIMHAFPIDGSSPSSSHESLVYLAVLEAREQSKPGPGLEKAEAVFKQIESKCLQDPRTMMLYQQMMRRQADYLEMLSTIMKTQNDMVRGMAQNLR